MSETAEKPKLTKRHLTALRECASWQAKNRSYWWRQKSMADLEVHGLVRSQPSTFSSSLREFVVTLKGLDFLGIQKEPSA